MGNGKGNNYPTLIMEVENEKETGIYTNENGEMKLKDNASKLLLSIAYKKQLQGKSIEAERIFNTVSCHASDTFNIDNELASAQSKAIEILLQEEKIKAIKKSGNETTINL